MEILDINDIQKTRINIWKRYYNKLKNLAKKDRFQLPELPEYATNNGHVFYLVTKTKSERDKLLDHLNDNSIQAVFHYLPLHLSPYYKAQYIGKELKNVQKFSDRLIRLPLFYELKPEIVDYISEKVVEFYT